jgi:hypothetical protein
MASREALAEDVPTIELFDHDPTLASALLDRLLRHANGSSGRKKAPWSVIKQPTLDLAAPAVPETGFS